MLSAEGESIEHRERSQESGDRSQESGARLDFRFRNEMRYLTIDMRSEITILLRARLTSHIPYLQSTICNLHFLLCPFSLCPMLSALCLPQSAICLRDPWSGRVKSKATYQLTRKEAVEKAEKIGIV